MKGTLKFTSIIMHRNTNYYCKGQRTQLKIWFLFCQSQLCLFKLGKVHSGLGFQQTQPCRTLVLSFIEISRARRDNKEHITSQSIFENTTISSASDLHLQYIVEGRDFKRSQQPANFGSFANHKCRLVSILNFI